MFLGKTEVLLHEGLANSAVRAILRTRFCVAQSKTLEYDVAFKNGLNVDIVDVGAIASDAQLEVLLSRLRYHPPDARVVVVLTFLHRPPRLAEFVRLLVFRV